MGSRPGPTYSRVVSCSEPELDLQVLGLPSLGREKLPLVPGPAQEVANLKNGRYSLPRRLN